MRSSELRSLNLARIQNQDPSRDKECKSQEKTGRRSRRRRRLPRATRRSVGRRTRSRGYGVQDAACIEPAQYVFGHDENRDVLSLLNTCMSGSQG